MFSSIIDYIYSVFTQTFFGGAIKVNDQWYFLNPPNHNNGMLGYRTRLDIFEEIEYIIKKLNRFNYKVDQFTLIRFRPKDQTINVPTDVDIPIDVNTNIILIEPLSILISSH